ncbi:MAG: FG-GAP-like repeat-containing protein [Myxococcota bacterium]
MSRLTIAITGLSLLVAACGGETGGEPTEPSGVCSADSDCAADQVCESGACVDAADEPGGDGADGGGTDGGATESDTVTQTKPDTTSVEDTATPDDVTTPDDVADDAQGTGPDAIPQDAAPTASISAPQDDAEFSYGAAVALTAAVSDDLDAPESLTATWTSDLQGDLGASEIASDGATTLTVEDLLPGSHLVTLSVTDSADQVGTDTVSFLVNTAPGAPEVSIGPASPTTLDDLVVSIDVPALDLDRDASQITYLITWMKDGEPVEGLEGETVAASETSRDQLWLAVVTPFDGLNEGAPATAEVTIQNAAPTCSGADLTPIEGDTTTVFTCGCLERADADDDAPVDTCVFTSVDGTIDEVVDAEEGLCQLDPALTVKGMTLQCDYQASDGDADAEAVTSEAAMVVNAAPLAPTVSIDPGEGTVKTAYTCLIVDFSEDADGDVLSYATQWYVNGYPSDGATASLIVADALVSDIDGTPARGGDSLRCEIVADDGEAYSVTGVSQEIVLQNSAPAGGQVVVTPGEATETTSLTCDVSGGGDADGDEVTWALIWYVDDVATEGLEDGTLSGDAFNKHQVVRCSATPSDGTLTGDTVDSSNSVTVANTPPPTPNVVMTPESAGVANTLLCDVTEGGADVDGDEVTYEVTWVVNGFVNAVTDQMSAVAGALMSDAEGTLATGGDSVWCQARAFDGEAYSEALASEQVVLDNSAPTGGAVVVSPAEATVGNDLTCEASEATDADGDDIIWTYAWFIGDEVIVGQTEAVLAAGQLVKGQSVTCAAAPGDGQDSGDVVVSANTVVIANSPPAQPMIQVSPPAGAVTQFYTCSLMGPSDDLDGDDVDYTATWLVNGYENSGILGAPVAAAELVVDAQGTLASGGDALVCRVIAHDGTDPSTAAESSPIVFGNASPMGGEVTLTPLEAREDDELSCEASGAVDPDGQEVFWLYSWTKNEALIEGVTTATLDGNHFDKGDSIGCQATPTDGQAEGAPVESDLVVTILNTVPTTPLVALSPQAGGVTTVLTCETQVEGSDDDPTDVLTHTVSWLVNGYENPDVHEPTLSGADLVADVAGAPAKGGDSVMCVVRASDGEASSAPGESNVLTLENTAPEGGSVTVDPAEATEEDTLSCLATGATDADGQLVEWSYVWVVNGGQVEGQTGMTLDSSFFGSGDGITCIATPTDGETNGDPVTAENTVSISNTLPTPPTLALNPGEGKVITEFTCDLVTPGDDVDGDLLTYEKRWVVNGFVNELWQEPAKPINLVSDAEGSPVRGGDTFACQVRANDGLSFSEVAVTEVITLQNTPPSGGAVWVSPPEAAVGVTLTCEASGASDADGDDITWTYVWFAGDVEIEGQTDASLTSEHFAAGDIVRCEAIASDGEESGPILESENAVQVGNTLPTAPEVVLSPEAGTVETDFTCSVTEPSTDSDGDALTYITHWVVNGYENVSLDAATTTPQSLASDALGTPARGGDTISCRVRASDSVGLSEAANSVEVVLANTPPSGGQVVIIPETVKEGGQLKCNAEGALDLDGDVVTWSFEWFVNDASVPDQTDEVLLSEHFDKHDTVTCEATPSDSEEAGEGTPSENSAAVLNTPPLLTGITLSPSETNRLGTFDCTVDGWSDVDPADTGEGVTYGWLQELDGELTPIAGEDTATLSAEAFSPGDKVACRVTPFDDDEPGVALTSELGAVVNSLPTLTQVALSPGFAFSDSVMNCTPIDGDDIDGDTITYSYLWLLNDVELPDATEATLAGVFDKDDTLRCVVTPHDGVGAGLSAPSNDVTVKNTLPSLSSATVSPTAARLCESFTCSVGDVSDPDPSDQGSVSFFYRWTVAGAPMSVTTPTLTLDDAVPGDQVRCHVSPWDGALQGNLQPQTGEEVTSNPGTYVNPAPTLSSVTVTPDTATRGDTLTCEHSGYNDDCNVPGIFTVTWLTIDTTTLEETQLGETSDTLDTTQVTPGLDVRCIVNASDGYADLSVPSSNGVVLENAPPVAGSVNLEAPDGADGDVICNVVVEASDQEPLTKTFLWRIGSGAEFEGSVFLANSEVDHCDRIRCRLQVSDGDLTATTATSELIMPLGSGSDCDDGNVCTSPSCGDNGGCVQSHADGFCDDGVACTQEDTCLNKECVGEPYSCDDEEVCTDDVCNGDGSCSHPDNTAPCDDLTACTIGDTCSGGLCQGTSVDCSIYNTGCFAGVCAGPCNEGDDCACIGDSCAACVLEPVAGQSCDDGDACTLNDVCSETGSCAGEWDKFGCGCTDDAKCEADPEYNDACHVGRCDLDIFKCYAEQQADGYACDDADLCTHTDECVAGVCTSTPYDCDDTNLCTDDSCNGDGTCTNDANTLACDDGDACTTDDTCHSKACVGGVPPTCDDDAYCNGLETCDSAVGCVDGTAPVLDDGVACTVDTCDEVSNTVVHTPTDSLCDTGTVCVADTCDATLGCQSEALSNCCGNGIVEDGEICDDGNATGGDGCSATCTCECGAIEQSLCVESSGPPPVDPNAQTTILGAFGTPPYPAGLSAVVGDVDGDGDPDLIIGYETGATMLYKSNGAGGFEFGQALPRPSGNTSPTTALVLGDTDNDGDLDLVIGYNGAHDRLVLNDGSANPFISDSGAIIDSGDLKTTSIDIGDIEPDGDLDLVVGHTGAHNHYVRNFGGTFVAGGVFSVSEEDTRDVAFIDADGNGQLDIAVANYGAVNKVYSYVNVTFPYYASANYDLGSVALKPVEDTLALLVGDFNQDGYMDLAVGNDVGHPDRVYTNLAHIASFPSLANSPGLEMGVASTQTTSLSLADYDGNGAMDIVRSRNGANDVIFNNGGDYPYYTSPGITLDPPDYAYDTRIIVGGDFDADGANDAVIVNAGAPTLVGRFDYAAPLVGVIAKSLSDDLLTTRAIALGDVSQSGSLDVILAQDSGELHLIPNNRTSAPFLGLPAVVVGGDDEAPMTVSIADIDKDGWNDLVVGNSGKVNRLYLNSKTFPDYYPSASRIDLGTAADTTTGSVVADFDNDGDLDIAVVNDLAPNKLYMNDLAADEPFAAGAVEITTDADASYDVAAADFNADGLIDLVIANADGPAQVVLNVGGAAPFGDASASPLNQSDGATSSVAVGDVDGDGDIDIVCGQFGGAQQLFLNGGPSSVFDGVNPTAIGSAADATMSVALSDVDKDGDLDVLVGNSDGANRVYLNNGTSDPFAGAAGKDITADGESTVGIVVGRIDPDAKPDLIAANEDGATKLYRNLWIVGDGPTEMCVAECPAIILACDDGLYCNGEESCLSDHSCVDGTAPTDSDGIDCTVDQCDEALDTFVFVPDDGFCTTDNLCMESICSTNLGGCVEQAVTPCCGDGNLDDNEDCDDENIDTGDGCGADCRCECEITGPFACMAGDTVEPFISAVSEQVADTGADVADVVVGDVDGDGDMDTIVATASTNLLYVNTGASPHYADESPVAIGTESAETRALALADFDGDGDLDLVAGNFDGPTRYYANDGSATPFDTQAPHDIEVGKTEALAVADVNGDGRLDLIIGNQNERDRVHLNTGQSPPFTADTGQDMSASALYTTALAVGDVDNDGDVDVVAGHLGQNRLYLNGGGDSGLVSQPGVAFEDDYAHTIALELVDADKDGDLDLLIANEGAPLYYWDNAATSPPYNDSGVTELFNPANNISGLAVADFDGDGSSDFALSFFESRPYMYYGDGSATPFVDAESDEIGTIAPQATALRSADMNGDGAPDLAMASSNAPLTIFYNTGARSYGGNVEAEVASTSGDTRAIASGDMDRDGDIDLVIGYRNSPNTMVSNNDSVSPFTSASPSEITSDSHDTRAIAVGDLNGDGWLDVVSGNRNQVNRLYLSNGTSSPFDGVTGSDITADADDTRGLALGDIDGDGDLDLFVGNHGVPDRIVLNNGTLDPFAGASSTALGDGEIDTWAAAIVDLNGDGHADIASANHGGVNVYYKGAGDGTFTAHDLGTDDEPSAAIAVGDINGDGALDVVIGNQNKVNRVYVNDVSTLPFQAISGRSITSDVHSTRGIAVGDLDMDGDLDVFAANTNQPLRVYLNDGTIMAFDDNAEGANIFDIELTAYGVVMDQLDRDGRLDVAVANKDGLSYWLANHAILGETFPDGCGGLCLPQALTCEDNNTCTSNRCTVGAGCDFQDVVPNCCGNGIQESGEACDDGNQNDGDTCNSSCSGA